ncbi:major facilitator superfamily domain-containing protein [Armillaria luteobubalina]|uniref:Major facilitator superfamily domain-containing protein n=1 Tax=Armillaria luteobubalina TaxID=153913 RepID=A0AA39PEP1_9AGAR|nr:major facilitator superfamily domain-containing protein [Armillaria luteobubalina]
MADSLQHKNDARGLNCEESHHSIELGVVSPRRVWLKLDLFLLPVLAVFHFLLFLLAQDKTSIGNARIAGLQRDLQMTNNQYSIALTATYITNIAAELPSNLLLRVRLVDTHSKVVGPNYLLPTIMTSLGVFTTLQGVVTSYDGLLACRFFLGVFEAGVSPRLALYLTHFYPHSKMTIRIAAFFASGSLSGAFSGMLAYGIIRLDGVGGRAGWRWIFILEGSFTVAWGLIIYFLMPRNAMTARFLRPAEREYVASQVAESGGERFEWREVRKALIAPHVWIIGIVFFFTGAALFGLAFFTPSIVQSLGYTSARSQLMTVPPFAIAFALSMVTAFLCDRFPVRGLVCIGTSIIALIGFTLFLTLSSAHAWYGGLSLSISGVYAFTPTLVSWNSSNSAPHVRRATAIAITFVLYSAGGILSTWLMGSWSMAPQYVLGTTVMVAFSGGMAVGSALCLWYFVGMNRKKANMLEQNVKGMDGDLAPSFVYLL